MNLITQLRRYRWIFLSKRKINKQITAVPENQKLKIILGSGGTSFTGWIATDFPHFDITKENDWKYFFSKRKIDNLLAEHVLEHLTEKDIGIALGYAYCYLQNGGNLRIAVPDANHPNPDYIAFTKPPYHGHQSFWNHKTFSLLAEKNNFTVILLEHYDENKNFFKIEYLNDEGFITRSKLNNFLEKGISNYTSLILDLKKNEF